MIRRVAVLVTVLTGALTTSLPLALPADAATVSVAITNFAFSPHAVTVGQGGTVKWTQLDPNVEHTSTSDQGFWNSGRLATNQTFLLTRPFRNAGTYRYHCNVHPDMTGVVRVPLAATGSPSKGWTVRWSVEVSVPPNPVYDVQIKRPGATRWSAFRTDTSARKVFFNPSRAGNYAFRARNSNVVNGKESGWSPVRWVKIT